MVQKLVAVLVPVTVDADVANQCAVHHVVADVVVDVVADAVAACVDKSQSTSSKFKMGDRVRDGMKSVALPRDAPLFCYCSEINLTHRQYSRAFYWFSWLYRFVRMCTIFGGVASIFIRSFIVSSRGGV